MPRTPQEIIDEASLRRNPNTESQGMLTRQDIVEFISLFPEETRSVDDIRKVLDTIPFLTAEQRLRIIDDLPSYGY